MFQEQKPNILLASVSFHCAKNRKRHKGEHLSFFPFYSVHGPWMILIAESNSLEASTKFSIRLIAAHNRVYSLINKILPQVTLKTKHVDCECKKVHRNRMEWDEESVEDDTMTSIHIGHLIDTIYCINPLHLCTFTSTHIYGI